ncbi:P-loop NTPase family protein [Niallia sp. MER TA 168]|uniref:hypothetical protein n=1 Tax=Niallia sp. MER TA 168 TaxID=2939568 RepID=UPI002041085E|nr:hypothetical protein [Niallia sp. MER TA 168]MCM3364329.1 hypothetical protein [Niallia sp. MER TA 168]
MSKKVLIAVGDKSYTKILFETFSKYPDDFTLSKQEILHRRYLYEIVKEESPSVLIVHDTYLESVQENQRDKDKELISIIKQLRLDFDDSLRIVFLCERSTNDPLLSRLVSMGVLDIFNTQRIDIEQFINQLKGKVSFAEIAPFLNNSLSIDGEEIPALLEEDLEEEDVTEEKTDKQQIEKNTKEKTVVQKIVQKNVIKREYSIHVHNAPNEKVVGIPVKRKTILIGSFYPRNGTTFVSHLLARSIANYQVSTLYVEDPLLKPYTYDRFYGHEFAPNYISKWSTQQENNSDIQTDWIREGVQLICHNPTLLSEEPAGISFEDYIKLLYTNSSLVTIIDVGSNLDNEIVTDLLEIADHLFIVLDSDVTQLQGLGENSLFASLIESEITHIIGNRFNEKIKKNPLIQDLFKDKLISILPSFQDEDVYVAQYQGMFLNDYKDYRSKVNELLVPILELLLPNKLLKAKGSGILNKLFNRKIKIEKKNPGGNQYE